MDWEDKLVAFLVFLIALVVGVVVFVLLNGQPCQSRSPRFLPSPLRHPVLFLLRRHSEVTPNMIDIPKNLHHINPGR